MKIDMTLNYVIFNEILLNKLITIRICMKEYSCLLMVWSKLTHRYLKIKDN